MTQQELTMRRRLKGPGKGNGFDSEWWNSGSASNNSGKGGKDKHGRQPKGTGKDGKDKKAKVH